MKKKIIGLGLVLLGAFAHAQNGLENITVEKYYVSNATDAAGSVGTLPVGSVTYRIYADMLPGYKFQVAYGNAAHELRLSTSTSFFNNEDRGATSPNAIASAQLKNNTVALDSWLSTGGAAAGQLGVLKTEDNGAANLLPIAANPMLKNADPSAGIALNIQDGIIAGTPEAVTFVGLTTELDVFDVTSQVGGLFSTTGGAWSSLSGSTGPTAANRVLIAQITTDGVFGFELNIQIGTPLGGTQNFVARNPTGAEISIPSLILAPNLPPTVNITAPSNGANLITGDVVAIAANSTDADGTVSSVEFFVDNVSIGVDNTAPYTANYTSAVGTHSLTAKATDDDGDFTISSIVTINVANNQAPSVSVSAAATAIVGDVVAIDATASDIDGTVASVEFFVDNVSIGTDATAPFSMNWTAVLGSHSFKGRATDDRGAQTTSSIISISVVNNIPPTVSITSPLGSATYTAPQVVTIDVTAGDVDGTVTQVEFFINNVSIGIDATAPYTFDWTSVIGAASITAKATDNKGAITTSAAIVLSIADPNALPYVVPPVNSTCLETTINIPVAASDTVANVIGYDVVMSYNVNKVTPTGIVTVSNALINPSYVDVVNSIDGVNGLINISVYFNSNAPANAQFSGVGNIFTVEFNKTGIFASIDTSVFTVVSLQESYITGVVTKLTQPGEYTSYKDSIFNGALRFWFDNSAIKYNIANPNDYVISNIYGNDVNCANASSATVQPDLSGNFVYNISNGVDVNIQKDILGTTDVQPVVNGFDALQVRKVLLNDLSFTPSIYQMIAMDVNTDGAISAGDVSQINQRAVLMIPEFKQAWNYNISGISDGRPSKDWLFVDSVRVNTNAAYQISATYPSNDGVGYSKSRVPVVPFCLPVPMSNYPSCPLITGETYKGVLVGDVNGNYASVNGGSNQFKQENGKVVFDLSHAVISGGHVDVPVSIVSANNVNALDFSMQFNEENLTFHSVVDNTTYLQALANYNSADKTLRVTSNSLQNYDLSKSPVSVRFAMNKGQISAADFNSLAGYLNGDKVGVEVMSAVTGISTIKTNENLVAIYPNPATEVLNVVVAENATIQLLDIDGKQVILQANVNANQKQEINTQNIANGIYIMKIYNDNFVSMTKVVINR